MLKNVIIYNPIIVDVAHISRCEISGNHGKCSIVTDGRIHNSNAHGSKVYGSFTYRKSIMKFMKLYMDRCNASIGIIAASEIQKKYVANRCFRIAPAILDTNLQLSATMSLSSPRVSGVKSPFVPIAVKVYINPKTSQGNNSLHAQHKDDKYRGEKNNLHTLWTDSTCLVYLSNTHFKRVSRQRGSTSMKVAPLFKSSKEKESEKKDDFR